METAFRVMALAGFAVLAACGSGATEVHTTPAASAAGAAPVPASADTAQISEALASVDGFVIASGDIRLVLHAAGCDPFVDGLLICDDDVRLQVAIPREQLQQTLRPETIVVKAGSVIYRGPLLANDRPDAHSLVFSDINHDGHDDLMLWSGRDGAYGGPSFEVYLFDQSEGQFRSSQAFSDLTVGNTGLFGVDGRFITTDSKSGCCLHVAETHVIDANTPTLVERITTEDAPGGSPNVTIERLLDGELKIVDDE